MSKKVLGHVIPIASNKNLKIKKGQEYLFNFTEAGLEELTKLFAYINILEKFFGKLKKGGEK